MRKETSKIQITAKLLVAAAAIVHLIFTYVHTNALLLLEDQICGFIMFLFVLLGLVTLFEATQIHGERIREEVLTALLCMGTIALGMQLVGIYQQAIQIQSSLDVAVVQKAILFSAGLMTAFGAAGIWSMQSNVILGAKRYEEVPEELVHGQPESRADALVAGGNVLLHDRLWNTSRRIFQSD